MDPCHWSRKLGTNKAPVMPALFPAPVSQASPSSPMHLAPTVAMWPCANFSLLCLNYTGPAKVEEERKTHLQQVVDVNRGAHCIQAVHSAQVTTQLLLTLGIMPHSKGKCEPCQAPAS